MNIHQHYVVAFFSRRADAEKTLSQVAVLGVYPQSVQIFDKHSVLPTSIVEPELPGNKGTQTTWADKNLMSLAKTGLRSLLGIEISLNKVSLIVERSLIGSMVTLGWGIEIGVVGSNFYNRGDAKLLSDVVHDAILSRHTVVVVKTNSMKETSTVVELVRMMTGNIANLV